MKNTLLLAPLAALVLLIVPPALAQSYIDDDTGSGYPGNSTSSLPGRPESASSTEEGSPPSPPPPPPSDLPSSRRRVGGDSGDSDGGSTNGAGVAQAEECEIPHLRNFPNAPIDSARRNLVGHLLDRLLQQPATAGIGALSPKTAAPPEPLVNPWFRNPALYALYTYMDIADDRTVGFDGQSNGFEVGGDFLSFADFLVGANYAFGEKDTDISGVGGNAREDSHAVDLALARSFAEFVSAGITLGYSRVDTDIGGTSALPDGWATDSWAASPFVGVFKTWHSWAAAGTVTYSYVHDDYDVSTGDFSIDSGKLELEGTLGYAFTERLFLTALLRYTEILHRDDPPLAFPEDRNWLTVGGKVSFRPVEALEVYAAYDYDALNDTYENQTFRLGVPYAF